jgi:hypothetical protein
MDSNRLVHHLLPWIVGMIAAVLMVAARLLTNATLLRRRESILLSGSTDGAVSPWISALYLLGQAGLLVAFFWSFAISWWAPGVPAVLYLLVNLARSRVIELRRELKDGPYKRCEKCGTVRPVCYFAIDPSTSDRSSSSCVACSNPEVWAMTQRLKEQFGN